MHTRAMISSSGLAKFLAGALSLCFLLAAGQAFGRIFVVDREGDGLDVRCLRGAVIQAQFFKGNNSIILTRQHYRLSIGGASELAGKTGDLDCTVGNLTIVGVGTNVTINAGSLGDRAFRVFKGAQLNLINVNIVGAGGYFVPDGLGGGAIYNAGVVYASGCNFSFNGSGDQYPHGGNGGAIGNSGHLVLDRCLINSNVCLGESNGSDGCNGGALWNSGTALVNRCEFRGNVAGVVAEGNGGAGGAIFNRGTLKLYNSVVDGNFTTPGIWGYIGDSSPGGGIFNIGTAILDGCTISHNGTGERQPADNFGNGGNVGVGGGIWNGGSMTVNRSTISENTTGAPHADDYLGVGGSGGDGAGLYNSGTLLMMSSTVYGNVAADGGVGGDLWVYGGGVDPGVGARGGGIFNAGNAEIGLSTISGNLSGAGGYGQGQGAGGTGATGGSGGGIYNAGNLDLLSCTVVLNGAGHGGDGGSADDTRVGGTGGNGGDGGGVFCETNGRVAIANTLIALNRGGLGGAAATGVVYIPDADVYVDVTNGIAGVDSSAYDVAGPVGSKAFNFIGRGGGSVGLTNGCMEDIVGTASAPLDPQIGALGNYGGPTPTHPLLPSSPLIDKGYSFGWGYDQRGLKRVVDFGGVANADQGDGCDIGAFELGSQ